MGEAPRGRPGEEPAEEARSGGAGQLPEDPARRAEEAGPGRDAPLAALDPKPKRSSADLVVAGGPLALQRVEDRAERRALVRETVGTFGLLGVALGGFLFSLMLAPGFLAKMTFILSGVALWGCALLAIWPRTRRFTVKMNRATCPHCGSRFRVRLEDILSDVGNARPSKVRSPSGFPCYEVMCNACGRAHRYRRTGKLVGPSDWRRDGAMEARARARAEEALDALDRGAYEEIADFDRMFWDGAGLERAEWVEELRRGRGILGAPKERPRGPEVHWSNHPGGIAYALYLEEQHLAQENGPFDLDDYVSFTWTSLFVGAVATECVMLGLREDRWCCVGYRLDGIANYPQLDGVGRLSLNESDDRGALSASE